MYLKLESFRFGLDARRSEQTAQPGTLIVANNCHVNAGGEIEKRKAFLPLNLPANTFGLEPTNDALVIFGSDPNIVPPQGAWPVIYQLLQVPANANMVDVVFSCMQNGRVWLIAAFDNGVAYCFYDGILVDDFVVGLVSSGFTTPAQILSSLMAAINRDGRYAGSIDPNGNLTITGPSGINFDIDVSISSDSGVVVVNRISDSTDNVQATTPVASFRLYACQPWQAGVRDAYISYVGIYNRDTGALVDLVTAAQPGGQIASTSYNPVDLTNAVAARINLNTASTGYTAKAINDMVLIYATAFGAGQNNYTLFLQGRGVCWDDFAAVFAGTGFALGVTIDGLLKTSGLPSFPNGANTTITKYLTQAAAIISPYGQQVGADEYTAIVQGNTLLLSRTMVQSDLPVVAVSISITPTSLKTGSCTINGPRTMVAYTDPAELSFAATRITNPPTDYSTNVSRPVRCFVSGGTPPYFYSWTFISGDTAIVVNNPSSPITSFSAQKAAGRSVYRAIYVCNVVDSLGKTAVSSKMTVTMKVSYQGRNIKY